MRAQLAADRFLVCDGEPAVDLSTGHRVTLITGTAGGTSEQARWVARCDRLARLHHRSIARLIDFGVMGETKRFEAWRIDGQWRGSPIAARRSTIAGDAFLRASGLSTGRIAPDTVTEAGGCAVVLPDSACGYDVEMATAMEFERAPLEALGLDELTQASVAALAEVFDETGDGGPRVLAIAGPPGAGAATAVGSLARIARLRGFVPLSSRVDSAALPLLAGRSILFIVSSDTADGWRRFMSLTLSSHKPHVILFTSGARETMCSSANAHTMVLAPFASETLAAAIQPRLLAATHRRQIEAAARRSMGLPGRFTELLWGRRAQLDGTARTPVSRAAETVESYGPSRTLTTFDNGASVPQAWVGPQELGVLSRRAASAIDDLSGGRHARGERILRQTMVFQARRHDWSAAAQSGLALAGSLVKRGQPRHAVSIVSSTHRWAQRSGNHALVVQTGVLIGVARLDAGQLDQAETVLRGTLAAAEGLGQQQESTACRIALARCLFWRGQYAAGEQVLAAAAAAPLVTVDAVRHEAIRARLSVARGDLAAAAAAAARGVALADGSRSTALVAIASCAAAFVDLTLGDDARVVSGVARSLRAARLAHDPLLALRARLLGAECLRRQGQRRLADVLVSRLRHVAYRALPAIIKARVDLLADLASGCAPQAAVARHVRITGLGALQLFAPGAGNRFPGGPSTDDVVDILRCCQTADETASVLTNLSACLRTRLRAAAIAFFVVENGGPVAAASDGGRADPVLPRRILAMEQSVPPEHGTNRCECGVPVRYGGRIIGVLTARWLPASSVDSADAMSLLTTAAAAAGPAVAEFAARRQAPVRSGIDLIGTSAAIVNVRDIVDRVAPAPYAVLVEGESGTGKELVARALHRRGPRRDRPFCTLNCAALPDELVESELFGHARGAFTGALAERQGVFEEAHSGTLFLDEIGELSLRAQAKVLRTIQEGELRRVGENVPRRVDVRLVAATNRNLRDEVAAGRFRLDLLYRLDVLRIVLPPLRDRREDIALLADLFWREATGRIGSRATLGAGTLAALARYDWPGNVRELQNVLASLAVRSPRRGVVPVTALPPVFDGSAVERFERLDAARREFDAHFIRAALARSGGRRARAAEELGITRQGLTKLMARLDIRSAPEDPDPTLERGA